MIGDYRLKDVKAEAAEEVPGARLILWFSIAAFLFFFWPYTQYYSGLACLRFILFSFSHAIIRSAVFSVYIFRFQKSEAEHVPDSGHKHTNWVGQSSGSSGVLG